MVSATKSRSSQPIRRRTTVQTEFSKYGRSSAPGSTPARRRMSSVPSSIRTSTTSSTVTKPTTLPSFSSTGTARRLYLAILCATDSWSSSASTVIGRRRITSAIGPLEVGHHQVAQGERAQQPARAGFEHVAGVDRLLVAGHRADVPEGVADPHRGVEADELGGHDAARRVVRVLAEPLHLRAHVRAQQGQELAAVALAHLLDEVGALVRGHPFEDLGGAGGGQVLQDRRPPRHGGLVEDLHRARHRQHA